MSAGDESIGGTDDTNGPLPSGPSLSAPDLEAIDLLIEHEFDVARATAARPELAARLEAAIRLFGRLDAYPVEAPDDSLTDATMARIEQDEHARESRMRIDPSRGGSLTSTRWPDLWAVACVALVVVGVGLPLANWMRGRAAEAACADNMRQLGGGIARYVQDRGSMPYQASMMPDLSALERWTDVDNNRHLHALTDGEYVEKRCLCCGNDPTGEGYAYQVPSEGSLRAWRTGTRIPVIADRSPIIELTRMGMPIGHCVVNSPDHGGSGQNALFTDGSVEFVRSTTLVVPEFESMPRHLENIYLPMSDAERGKLEEGLDKPSEWIRLDVFLLN
jgi:hypothetical protein